MNIHELLNADLNSVTEKVPFAMNADGTPKYGFLVVSQDAPVVRAEQDRQRIENRKVNAAIKDKSEDEKAESRQKQLAANMSGLARACIVGWFGFTDGGNEAPFDHAKAVALLDKFPSWEADVLNKSGYAPGFLQQLEQPQ